MIKKVSKGQRPVAYFDDVEQCVDAIVEKVGKDIVFGMPLGLGKPNLLANVLYQRVKNDPTMSLRILTALSLEVPAGKSDLEKRFLDPFVERIWGDYPALTYLQDVRRNSLPPNIQVSEFFMKAGVFLDNPIEQQNYISSNYTHIARDMLENGVNVIAQMVGKKEIDGEVSYSLSCNPDVSPDLAVMMRELEAKTGYKVAVVGAVNNRLPFMYHDAMVPASAFDMIIDNPAYDYTLFSTPNMSVEKEDYLIGLHVSTLVRDGGTLQVGIGSLGDAIAYSMILRHTQNDAYRSAIADLGVMDKSGDLVRRIGGLDAFGKGLYGSSEMFVNGLLELYKAGILRRKVYDHAGLQRLLNDADVTEQVTPAMLDQLLAHKVIRPLLKPRDLAFLQRYGIFKSDIKLANGRLLTGDGHDMGADLSDEANLTDIAAHCLGTTLQGGILLHAGFFLGPRAFYNTLNAMDEAESRQFCMTTVDNVNHLYGDQELKSLQRKDGRFINTCLMVTLSGGVVSDGLEDGRVVSGVGGQYNFVSMSHALQDGRLIMMLRSHRTKDGVAMSNIVWNYGHMTIPRILRDIVVTEYGIANLRSKTDKEVMAALLNIADSRFQDDLLAKAKAAGKMPAGYEIPAQYRNNFPEVVQARFQAWRAGGLFPAFPFGNDFTEEELVLGKALKGLKAKMANKVGTVAGGLFNVIRGHDIPPAALPYLRRMQLEQPTNFKDKLVQGLLVAELIESGQV